MLYQLTAVVSQHTLCAVGGKVKVATLADQLSSTTALIVAILNTHSHTCITEYSAVGSIIVLTAPHTEA